MGVFEERTIAWLKEGGHRVQQLQGRYSSATGDDMSRIKKAFYDLRERAKDANEPFRFFVLLSFMSDDPATETTIGCDRASLIWWVPLMSLETDLQWNAVRKCIESADTTRLVEDAIEPSYELRFSDPETAARVIRDGMHGIYGIPADVSVWIIGDFEM